MRPFLTTGLLAFLLFIGANAIAGERTVIVLKKRTAKTHFVNVKPVARQGVIKPSFVKAGFIWTEGYWKWNNRSKTYMWINGKVVRKKKASYVRSVSTPEWDKQMELAEVLWDQLSVSPCPLTEAGFHVE